MNYIHAMKLVSQLEAGQFKHRTLQRRHAEARGPQFETFCSSD